jgi:hypothetical protein
MADGTIRFPSALVCRKLAPSFARSSIHSGFNPKVMYLLIPVIFIVLVPEYRFE